VLQCISLGVGSFTLTDDCIACFYLGAVSLVAPRIVLVSQRTTIYFKI